MPSTCGSVRIPTVTFISQRTTNDAVNVKAPTATRPSAWMPSWWKPPP
jgi:hypothetical protein